MLAAPKRITLVNQVADSLRRGLDDQLWHERLPSEKILATHLQVSRMTLRRALKIMVQERRLLISNGKRTQILFRRETHVKKKSQQIIGVISPTPIDAGSRYAFYYESYRTQMQTGGAKVNFYFGSRFYGNRPGPSLEGLTREAKVDLWVLLGSTARLQHWFFDRGIPAIVDGSCHPGIKLPALDIDYRSVCRHAVGQLIALGHQRIVFLNTISRTGGDLASEAGFKEACHQGVSSQILSCDGSVGSVQSALNRLFRGESRPTAILTQQWLPFTVLTSLQEKGIQLPAQVSLIARDDLPNLENLVPAVARYGFKNDVYTQRLIRMTWKFFEGTLQPQQEFFLPDFIKGASLAPAIRLPAMK